MDKTFDLNDEQDISPAHKFSSSREHESRVEVFMPDIQHVKNWQLRYMLKRNKKYTIETDVELHDAFQHFRDEYQMWLDPIPTKAVQPREKLVQAFKVTKVYDINLLSKVYVFILHISVYFQGYTAPQVQAV